MNLKMFDYKFLLIIVLSMSLYFLYRRIESIEYKFKVLETESGNNENLIELPLPESEENQDNVQENQDNVQEDLELPLPLPHQESNNLELPLPSENNTNFETISLPFNSNQISSSTNHIANEENTLNNTNEHVNQHIEILDNDISVNKVLENEHEGTDVNLNGDTVEEYSNENSEIQIYSNDNEEEQHSSLMESMVEAIGSSKEDENCNKLNVLLKNNKLPELQQKAQELNINIHKENSKKTKLELANDILNLDS